MPILFRTLLKRKLLFLLALLLLNPGFGPLAMKSTVVHAEANNSPALQPSHAVTLNSSVTDWVYDEHAGSIYAISSTENKLSFVNAQDLSIEQELLVGSIPLDIEQNDNELYIALSGASRIQVVDISSRSLGSIFTTVGQPISLAVTSDYIFYVTSGVGSDYLYKLDRATGSSTAINTEYVRGSVLRADENNHLLFVGETGSTGSKLIAIDYLTKQISSRSTYAGNYGFGFPYPKIMFDGTDVFFGGSRMDGNNLAVIHGAYPRLGDYSYLDAKLLDLNGQYVATSQGIFDKDRYLKIAGFPYEASKALIAANGRVFLQKEYEAGSTIEAYDLDLSASLPTLAFEPGTGGSIKSNYKIDSWTTNEASPFLYLVSSETNELAVLRKDDLSLVTTRYVGSKPIDIALRDGKLYIALRGETYIGVLDTNAIESNIQRILIPSNPSKVMPAKKYTFYWGQDTFFTFHATDGTTDRRVFPSHADSPELGSAYYDSSNNTLYTGTSGAIYQLNADTLNVDSKDTVLDFWSSGKLEVNGDSLYFSGKRMSKNAVRTILGTYPEQIIHAFDDLVFGQRTIYDRDTYVKKVDLPFTIQDAYVSNDQSIYLSTEKEIYKFAGIDVIREYFDARMKPKNLVVVDTGSTPGQISGYLLFDPAEDRERIINYSFNFLDADGNRLNTINASWDKSLEDGRIMYTVSQTDIPVKAQYIAVNALSRDQSIFGSARSLIWDVPKYFAKNFMFSNQSSDPKLIQGKVSWSSDNEYANVTYQLYFLNEDGLIGDSIVDMEGGKASYAFDISKTELLEDVFGLALVQTREQSPAPVYQYLIFDQFITPDLRLSDIVLNKSQSSDDAITINNVQAGDVINVYSNKGLIGSGEVKPGATSILMKIRNIGNPGEKLLLTRTMPGKFESEGIVITIPPIINGDGGVPTNPESGGPGPVNPGPGPVSPGSGSAAVPSKGNDSSSSTKGLEIKIEKNSEGKTVAKIDVPTNYMESAIKDDDFQKTKTISLVTDSKEPSIVFHVYVDDIQKILRQSNDGKMKISVPAGSWTINVQSLLESISKDKSNQTIGIMIEQADDKYISNLMKYLPQGNQLLGKPVNFEAIIMNSGKTRVLNNFSQYVNHTISVQTASVPLNELAGLMFDPSSNTFVPVPAKFEYRNGMLIASLYQKGDSTYVIVRNKATFKDIPSSSAYAENIQTLANRAIVNGLPDGTFKPDNKVTRAEFAVMLGKALGMTMTATSSENVTFKDVQKNSWYFNHVQAAVQAGIIAGYEDGSFKPNQTITHQEMVAMLVKAVHFAGYNAPASSDQVNAMTDTPEIPTWAKSYYDEAKKIDLIGRANDPFLFKTNAEATKKDCAMLIYRLINDVVFQ
ncbi:S-layer homology domain-containing protein [Paenibacillus terrigena]|uniref:S-layer homology domain-containing protein n=1 Tax=Paenibacillus terrigena TaxID=369333 RepID=UPI0028D8589E|nr:S-layer homology domain-containing protein [Paenibacillus terrigena]